jgi:CO/xanthine dehydrogenase Mo-binding subunit
VAVITGPELAARSDIQTSYGPVFRDQPILAGDRVRYVGDPVAAVAAVDIDVAEEALALIDVEYEELPAVFDLDSALADGAPLVHEEEPHPGETFADVIIHSQAGSNVCNQFRLRRGEVERALAEAEHVFEDEFTSPPVQHVPLETHACVATFEGDRVTVWSSTQTPFNVRAQLAEVFRVPASKVRVLVPTLGGGFGGKCYPKLEPVTAVLAQAAGRPVRLHLTRQEEFVTITKHGVRIVLRTGLDRAGRIVARKSTCHFNTGAYADIGPRLIRNGGYGSAGPYSIPNLWIDSYAVYTNLPPAGAFRGYGVSQAAWAYESQMDMIADRIGIDPYELRRRNLLTDGQPVMTGEPMRGAHLHELLDDAASWIGWGQPPTGAPVRGQARGKGLSCIIKSTVTPSTSSAAVRLDEAGAVSVMTSSVEMGQGLLTAMAIVAAERLGVPLESVSVSTPDTDSTPYDQQTSSSRSTHSMGGAVTLAVDDVRAQLKHLASDVLEVAPEDLELIEGSVRVKGAPAQSLPFGDLVRRAGTGSLRGEGTFSVEGGLDPETGQGVGSVHWHQAVGAAEIAVDLETGKIDLLRYRAGVYAGRVINPVQAELQTEGNVAFGLGQALFEELVFDGGQLQNGSLADYMIASIQDLPGILDVQILEDLDEDEVHGLGETSLPPVMAAVGNALFHATGVRITDLPLTPEKVLLGLRAK